MRTPDDSSVPDLTIGPLIRATHQDPWKNVGAQASKGRLVFHPAAAQSATQECADVMGTVGALRQEISNMGRLTELSHLASGSSATSVTRTRDLRAEAAQRVVVQVENAPGHGEEFVTIRREPRAAAVTLHQLWLPQCCFRPADQLAP